MMSRPSCLINAAPLPDGHFGTAKEPSLYLDGTRRYPEEPYCDWWFNPTGDLHAEDWINLELKIELEIPDED